jgi:hypothetical protein
MQGKNGIILSSMDKIQGFWSGVHWDVLACCRE